MIPNDFGLIRQKDHNLFALLFPYISDISEMHIELRYINDNEWMPGYISNSNGRVTSTESMKYAVIDVSKYDYVLIPSSANIEEGPSAYSAYTGLTISQSEINISYRAPLTPSSNNQSSYVFFELLHTDYKYAVLNQSKEHNMPIIGFIRHRSDNVNPKGIIKDVNSDLLQPVKENELNGEADRIRNELPGNAESPDLDSKSGSGADERADG